MSSPIATATRPGGRKAPAPSVRAPVRGRHTEILTPNALAFLAELHRAFDGRRLELLRQRVVRQQQLDAGERPDFPSDTADVRRRDWMVAPIVRELRDRRVEITGPPERKMVINALNSGANVFMADFEDAHAPTWANTLDGQVNLWDAVRGTIEYETPGGKRYELNERVATLLVRPRGWHLDEKHVLVDGAPIAGALFDFGLFFYHNAAAQLALGAGPYFYLPKLQNHHEARLWNDVFVFAQDRLGIPRGTIRATVLIEHVLAAFEVDEILWELKEHSAGLNCGRWDYIFSFIKAFRAHPSFVLPDRGAVTMERRFLRSYVTHLIRTCHRRRIHAMGGMAAQIPVKHDAAANEAALTEVARDKLREVLAGHDGTWVAHPGLVPVAKTAFDAYVPGPHQIANRGDAVDVTADDLLAVPRGPITYRGLEHNVDVAIQYLAAWLAGSGCVPIYGLMEDAATAEISRSQVWQWIRHEARLDDRRPVTLDLVRQATANRLEALRTAVGGDAFAGRRYERAAELFDRMVASPEFPEWLTRVAYEYLD
jgi:malate synthase